MRGIVIVVADLYRPADGDAAGFVSAAPRGALPGIECVARFGERAALAEGWRAWLAGSLGGADLASVAPARMAAAVCGVPGAAWSGPQAPSAQAAFAENGHALWIATPVQLAAGLAHVHLDHRGVLRLPRPQQAALAAAFGREFGALGFELHPLPSGDFLLDTCGIEPVATSDPARCAGGEVAAALPQGPASAALRRLLAEIEMWLHAQPLNEQRRRTGEPPVTALWLWGARGRTLAAAPRAPPRQLPQAFGCDAYLSGLWHLHGAAVRAVPARLEQARGAGPGGCTLLVVTVGGELLSEAGGTVLDALAHLDERFVSPALGTLRHGMIAGVTLVVNDTRLVLGRRGHLKVWRRARAALEAFA